jgi:2-oxoglutarate ferredoxin oxidoreductase subunit delta
MVTISVDEELCKGCELCINFCPTQALEKSKKLNKRGVYPPELADESKCNECRFCELICPDFAIVVVPEEKQEKKEREIGRENTKLGR